MPQQSGKAIRVDPSVCLSVRPSVDKKGHNACMSGKAGDIECWFPSFLLLVTGTVEKTKQRWGLLKCSCVPFMACSSTCYFCKTAW